MVLQRVIFLYYFAAVGIILLLLLSTSIKQHVYDITLKHELHCNVLSCLTIFGENSCLGVGYFILEKGAVSNLKDLMTVEVPLHFSNA